ncbi:hypothetical protein G5I_08392 [Acromyrmex echinatior]|uniref:Uncharacterized protein n=1 Tax=Acromyrmex echinatior TaxID=103372 RepID=F4WRE2_ACREC|nr:hypothetical protein G5I_08392 [Acromyrmex echinatior]
MTMYSDEYVSMIVEASFSFSFGKLAQRYDGDEQVAFCRVDERSERELSGGAFHVTRHHVS